MNVHDAFFGSFTDAEHGETLLLANALARLAVEASNPRVACAAMCAALRGVYLVGRSTANPRPFPEYLRALASAVEECGLDGNEDPPS